MNKFNYDKEAEKVLTENAKVLNPPKDLMNIIADLKVIGRREMQHLLRLRHKYTIMVANKKQAERDANRPVKEVVPLTEEQEEAELEKELDETIARLEKDKKR